MSFRRVTTSGGVQERSISLRLRMYWSPHPLFFATSYTFGNAWINFAAVPLPNLFFTVKSSLPVFGLTNDMPWMLSEVSPASTLMSRYLTGSSTVMKLQLMWSKTFTFGKFNCSKSESWVTTITSSAFPQNIFADA